MPSPVQGLAWEFLFFVVALQRAAQCFGILPPTALRSAAVIGLRFRRRRGGIDEPCGWASSGVVLGSATLIVVALQKAVMRTPESVSRARLEYAARSTSWQRARIKQLSLWKFDTANGWFCK